MATPPAQLAVPVLQPEVLAIQNHDTRWFTQGLYWTPDGLYISSGLYGRSLLIYQTPNRTLRYSLPRRYFAEGLTVIDDKLYLLTWKENTLLIFDKDTLKPQGQVRYRGEGWGLTHSADAFIMSDGSNQLQFRDQTSFDLQKRLPVNGVRHLNELEYVDGTVWANNWYDDHLYAIDSTSGCVLAKVNVAHLRKQAGATGHDKVTNGIAYDKAKQGLWVSGKYWSKRFLIQLPQLDSGHCS